MFEIIKDLKREQKIKMAEVSLKVLIAGRTYPITVSQDEEKNVMQVAKIINEKIKEFEQNFSVRDKQDLLAMCALNLLTNQQKTSQKNLELDKEQINQLDLFITDYLQKQSNPL